MPVEIIFKIVLHNAVYQFKIPVSFIHSIMPLYFDILGSSPLHVWELFNSELHSSFLLGSALSSERAGVSLVIKPLNKWINVVASKHNANVYIKMQ